MRTSPATTAAAIAFLLSLTSVAVIRADSLGLGVTPASDAAAGLLPSLPPALVYGAALAALAMLATLVFPRPHRAEMRDGVVTVEVLPPSARGESALALRAGIAILLAAFVLGAFRTMASRSNVDPALGGGVGSLAPFQVALAGVSPSLQATYRDLRKGLVEIERARMTSGDWPAVTTLAGAGVPPFAPSSATPLSYAWSRYADGASASYLGTPPAGGSAPAMLLTIIDTATQPEAAGETHRLADGRVVRTAIWFRPAGIAATAPTAVVVRPATERWMQLVATEDEARR